MLSVVRLVRPVFSRNRQTRKINSANSSGKMTPSEWTAASRVREFENWNTQNICTDFKLSVCKSCKKEKLPSVALLKHLNSRLTLTDGVLSRYLLRGVDVHNGLFKKQMHVFCFFVAITRLIFLLCCTWKQHQHPSSSFSFVPVSSFDPRDDVAVRSMFAGLSPHLTSLTLNVGALFARVLRRVS